MPELDGKVAIVTGVGRIRGLGRAVSESLAQAGCDVVVTGTGRDPSTFPPEEQEIGWRGIHSVADSVRSQASACPSPRRRRHQRLQHRLHGRDHPQGVRPHRHHHQ